MYLLIIDVTKPADIGECTTRLNGYLVKEGLNLLINNAGIANKKQYLGNLEKQSLIEQFDVNIFGPILLSQVNFVILF